ncbi:LysR family transcriptional regulator [Caballeronia sp. M1242]|uniref:LysR family transcriptional regulator n=1 Tax=Caballeronia sp. M1242 TaxID=2814653 RepID=UPI0019D066AA|nr:LysR family transcriptional regulator [Caballeronia sp. M1242]QSN63099.1 LysR family transcriptional regulator [Caballeronia sp. M1242]
MIDKKRKELDWQDMRMFLALGRYRSLSSAARALRVNHATVARRIQALEDSLGESLVERRPDGYVLTPAGESALAVAAKMEAAAQTLTRPAPSDGESSIRGLVRINAPPALSQGFLIARLTEITARHPGLDIDLATDLRSISLNRHKADIAVRVGRLTDADLIAKPVGSMAFGLWGTQAQCERAERGESPTFVSFNEESADMPNLVWLREHFPRSRIAFRAENHIFQAIAARDGIGLALLPHYLGRSLPGLRLCAFGPVPPPRDMWLLIRRQDRNDATIRAVTQHLTDAFKASEQLFAA